MPGSGAENPPQFLNEELLEEPGDLKKNSNDPAEYNSTVRNLFVSNAVQSKRRV